MAKTKSGPKKRRSGRLDRGRKQEDQVTEFLTVSWMMSVVTALLCELGTMAAKWYVWFRPEVELIDVMARLLMFAALVIGLISLGLMLLVIRRRQVPPPRGIVVFASVVGAAPLVAILLGGLL